MDLSKRENLLKRANIVSIRTKNQREKEQAEDRIKDELTGQLGMSARARLRLNPERLQTVYPISPQSYK
jgi:hypothetical protein